LGGGVILPSPEDAIYVFDEGHHLVDKSRNHFATMARLSSAESLIEGCREALAKLEEDGRSKSLDRLRTEVLACLEALIPAQELMRQTLEAELGQSQQESVRYPHGQVEPHIRKVCSELATIWSQCAASLGGLHEKLEFSDSGSADDKGIAVEWGPIVGQYLARSENFAQAWQAFASESSDPVARWIDIDQRRRDYTLRAIPLQPGGRLAESLWSSVGGAVLTSATMTSLGSFVPLLENLGLPEETLAMSIPSPFDFAGKAQLVVPSDCPDAGDARAHDQYLCEFLPPVLSQVLGTLVLFSSDRQMQYLAEQLVQDSDVQILVQGTHSKQEILRRHRERIDMGEVSVIFGLASFAEGIDLPGDYCSHVVIAKIPFPVPGDPVIESLGEWMQSQGRNAFGAVMLPAASLSLIQAVGRLLRSDSDTGRVTILDRRLVTRGYGRQLMDNLPPFSRMLDA
jgi:ATP-dependent DNA helicase DinG